MLVDYWKNLILFIAIIHGIANKTHIISHNLFEISFVLLYNVNIIRIGGILMANINVTIRMDEQLKAQADELFSDLGLSLSSAITMFAKQAVREQRIPFEVKRSGTTIQIQLTKKNLKAYKELAK